MISARRTTECVGCAVLVIFIAGAAGAQTGSRAPEVPTTRQAPDEFGTADYTVTTIGAGSFTPASDDNASAEPYYTDSSLGRGLEHYSSDSHFYATVPVPSGAVIDFIGLEGACTAPYVTGIGLNLVDRSGGVTFITGFSCSQHGYDTDYNASALGFQLAQNVHNHLLLDVEINNSATDYGSFAWVEVWWRRVVSPAPATQTFNDVAPSDFGYQYIEALAASGITGGCGGGNYCPDANLTRAQMAVFLSKALGLHWPY